MNNKANDVQTDETTDQPASSRKSSSKQCSRRGRLCQCVMAKAHSLNEVSSCNLDPDIAGARISVDAESGPVASRRRRKRYSESRSSAQKVSITTSLFLLQFVG